LEAKYFLLIQENGINWHIGLAGTPSHFSSQKCVMPFITWNHTVLIRIAIWKVELCWQNYNCMALDRTLGGPFKGKTAILADRQPLSQCWSVCSNESVSLLMLHYIPFTNASLSHKESTYKVRRVILRYPSKRGTRE